MIAYRSRAPHDSGIATCFVSLVGGRQECQVTPVLQLTRPLPRLHAQRTTPCHLTGRARISMPAWVPLSPSPAQLQLLGMPHIHFTLPRQPPSEVQTTNISHLINAMLLSPDPQAGSLPAVLRQTTRVIISRCKLIYVTSPLKILQWLLMLGINEMCLAGPTMPPWNVAPFPFCTCLTILFFSLPSPHILVSFLFLVNTRLLPATALLHVLVSAWKVLCCHLHLVSLLTPHPILHLSVRLSFPQGGFPR